MFMLFTRLLLPAAGFTVALTACLVAPPALSEPAPSYETLLVRLDDIPGVLEAEALYEAAEARVQQARLRPNPSVTLEAENVYGSGPYSGYGNADTTLSISQPLELWGKRDARIRAARAAADTAGLRKTQTRWLTAGQLAQVYAEAEAAAIRHSLAQEALALTEEDARAARILVDEGREAALHAIQASSEVDMARAAVDETQASLNAALAQLTALALLETPITSIDVDLLNRIPTPPAYETAQLPAIQVAQAELDTARRVVNVERIRARPDVTASVGLRRFEESGDEALTLGVSLPLPLFNRNQGAINAAYAEQRAAEARVLAETQKTHAALQAAHAKLDASISRTRAANNGVAAAEEAYRLVRIGFEAGRLSPLELRNFRAALIEARNTAVDARLERALAEIDLARLEGRLPFEETP